MLDLPTINPAVAGGKGRKDEKQFLPALPDLQTIRLDLTVFGHYINSFNRHSQNTFTGQRYFISSVELWRCQNYSLEIWPEHKHEKQKWY